MAHTPTPWDITRSRGPVDGEYDFGITAEIGGRTEVIAEAFGWVSEIHKSPAEANAAFIVRAVNAHEAVVEVLEELHAMVWGECPSLLNEDSGGNARLDGAIRAALALAKGEASQ